MGSISIVATSRGPVRDALLELVRNHYALRAEHLVTDRESIVCVRNGTIVEVFEWVSQEHQRMRT